MTTPNTTIGSFATFHDEHEARGPIAWDDTLRFAEALGIPIKHRYSPLEQVCVHEAGHAVSYLAHGLPFLRLLLWNDARHDSRWAWRGEVTDVSYDGAYDNLTPETDASKSLAGPLAEVLQYGASTHGCFGDLFHVRQLLQRHGWSLQTVRGIADSTRELLHEHRLAVVRIARALARRRGHILWLDRVCAIARFGANWDWEVWARAREADWDGTIVTRYESASPVELRQLHHYLRSLRRTRKLHLEEVYFREGLEELERRLGHTLYTEARRREAAQKAATESRGAGGKTTHTHGSARRIERDGDKGPVELPERHEQPARHR